jgi:iron complex transport system ATP-binding protein
VTVDVAGKRLVDHVDLDIGPGRWCSVVGPNGAGKTTLVRAVLGLVPHEGTVTVGGLDLRGMHAAERSRVVALVPQHPAVPPGMTVGDYVMLGRTARLALFQAESRADHQAVLAVLEELDLTGYSGRPLSSLSGGERQRAVLARALAQGAPLLVLDEPTTGLDLSYQQEVLDLLDRQRAEQGLTVLSTMHDLTLAGVYADELVLLAGGRVVCSGAPRETLTEENLALVMKARFRVIEEGGTTVVVPLAPSKPSRG